MPDPTCSTTKTLDPVMQRAIEYVIGADSGLDADVVKLGELCLPKNSDEARRCKEIKGILAEYSSRTKVSAPISIAIFGPPGSGKSRTARQIVENSGELLVVNLSQLADPKELTESFVKSKLGREQKDTPTVFFFDEFDAPLGNSPLGWLRWFLTPMQDGEFFYDGQSIKIGKAMFLFAGGTAESFDEFQKRARTDPAEYRDKKVPDFISRLRGFIDIQGVNNTGEERIIRRALVLRYQLDRKWPRARDSGRFPMNPEHVRKLLSNVHFVHGARSMEALLDMSRLAPDSGVNLPDNELMKLHLSRGLLDGKVIGISAGLKDDEATTLLAQLTDTLLGNGATLAYGGEFVTDGTLHAVVEAASKVPDDLVTRGDKRIRNYLGFPSYNREGLNKLRAPLERSVEFLDLKSLSDSEMDTLGVRADEWFRARPEPDDAYNPNFHLAWALSLFRMRARLIQDIHALIVLGGKDDGDSWGRFSGIAEEVMLAIALGKPIYVLGGRGGAAHAVGRLLGLGDTIEDPHSCLPHDKQIPNMDQYSDRFALPGRLNLPRSIEQLRNYLFDRSITTRAWPWNGLDLEDNRELFSTRIAGSQENQCVNLIRQGLLRLDWKLSSREPLLEEPFFAQLHRALSLPLAPVANAASPSANPTPNNHQ